MRNNLKIATTFLAVTGLWVLALRQQWSLAVAWVVQIVRFPCQTFLKCSTVKTWIPSWITACSFLDNTIRSGVCRAFRRGVTQELTFVYGGGQLPLYALVSFGFYSLAVIGYRVATFPTCPEASVELQRVRITTKFAY
jgi:hypothetical protein